MTALVLAAGKGTRMASPLPKVLHPVAGEPMVSRVITQAFSAGIDEVRVVVGHQAQLVRQVVEPLGASVWVQSQQRGTADAVQAGSPATVDGLLLILSGDVPLLDAEDIRKIISDFKESQADLAVVTSVLKNPASLGRIVRSQGILKAIVEVADASQSTLKINEVNSGIYIGRADLICDLLDKVKPNNAKGELYLTDIIGVGIENGDRVIALTAPPRVAFGVNTQAELAKANKLLFQKIRQKHLEQGVIMLDPGSVYIEQGVEIGAGTVIYPNVFLRGKTKIGPCCVLEPGVFLADSELDESVHVKVGSVFEKAKVGAKAVIGPYARLRPETEVGTEAHIGNFVELKKTKLGARSKANHLTYLGDATVGADVNIGCGTITCNYAPDRKKYATVIGDGAFVGSDVQFVAPVQIGQEAVIASGSTITEDVPERALAIARSRQTNKLGYTPKGS